MKNCKVEEVTLNYDEFTIVTVDTQKGAYQMSIRGHRISKDKISRMVGSIMTKVGG